MQAVLRNSLFPYRELPTDLDGIYSLVDHKRPWLATIYEPLNSHAPEAAQSLCCYLRTIIFYEHPYRVENGNFAEFDRLETRLDSNDVVEIDGRSYAIQSGRVRRDKDRWVMVWNARRQPLDETKPHSDEEMADACH